MWSDKKRSWGFLALAAISAGLPVFVGAWLGYFSSAVIASIGGLVILYMQDTDISRRMMILAVCSFGFAASFSLGILTSFNPWLSAGTLALTVFLVTGTCRFHSMPAPGSFFFILVACMSRTLPFDLALAAERTGILLFGCMGACLLALVYSIAQVLLKDHRPAQQHATGDRRVAAIILESAVIALFVGGGYLAALLLKLDNPYWVPISTAAIMQGATFRAIWHRNVHRVIGTVIGMGLAWVIFSLSPNVWELAGLIVLLSFIIEALVTRNYGLAVIFITPLTVIFADSAAASVDTERLILARLIDIMLGSVIGYLGGWVIHHPKIFYHLERWMVNR
jgi:uncharacterized membrane protein YccC